MSRSHSWTVMSLALVALMVPGLSAPPGVQAMVLACGVDTNAPTLMLTADVIVVSPDGNPDPRLTGIVQVACTPQEYAALWPEVTEPTSEVGTGDTQGELLEYLAENPSDRTAFVDQVLVKQEVLPVFGDDVAAAEAQGNVCLAKDCSRMEAPCEGFTCPESTCTFNCDRVYECNGGPCVPIGPPCLDPSCVPPPPCSGVDCLDLVCPGLSCLPCSGTDCLDGICDDMECVPCPDLDCVPPPPCDTIQECQDLVCEDMECVPCPDLDCVPPPPCDVQECVDEVCDSLGGCQPPCGSANQCLDMVCQAVGGCTAPCSASTCVDFVCDLLGGCNIPCEDGGCTPEVCKTAAECVDIVCAAIGGCDVPCDDGCLEPPCQKAGDCVDWVCGVVGCDISASGPGTMSASASSTPDVTVTIVFPAKSDAQSPKGRCNFETTEKAMAAIEGKFGKDYHVYCYDALNPTKWWTPSANGEVVDDNALIDSCDAYVRTNFKAVQDDANERVLCWVHQALRNGRADSPGTFALAAEEPARWYHPNHPNVGLALHEVLHTHDAKHYPTEFMGAHYWCGFYHKHWWGYHWHSFKSVMNYCQLKRGSKTIDSWNAGNVEEYMNW